jgi:chemotaxis protein MotB
VKSKKKNDSLKKNEEPAGGGWEIVYSGFVLILLCFFIMLSSFSSIEEAKVMQFAKSFVNAVSILPGGLKVEGGAAILPPSAEMVASDSQLAHIYNELKDLVERRNLERDVGVDFSPRGLVMRLSDRALFDAGVAAVSPQALPLLKKVGAVIAETSYEVRVEGHTDDVPIKTMQFPSNWELSTARAVNVLRYFIETYRIPRERLSAEGFGEFQPLVPNSSSENRTKNRRVEIIFLNPKPPNRPPEDAP